MIDLQTTILIASSLGAALFFGVGWLLERARRSTVQKITPRRPLDRPPTRAPERLTGAALASRTQAIVAEVTTRRALEEERKKRAAAEEAHDALVADAVKREAELAAMKAKLTALERTIAEEDEAHVEVVTALEVTLDAKERALAAAEEAHEREARIAGELRAQKAQLTNALEVATSRIEALQMEERSDARIAELRLQLELADERLANVDRLSEENVRLRASTYELEGLRADVIRLEEENAQLRAKLFVEEAVHAASLRPTGPRTTLDRTMIALASTAGVRSAVLADDLGFPVAGTGTNVDALAAFTGLLVDVGEKARAMLPIGEVRCVTLAAEHGVTVSVCPVHREDLGLALATLAIGPGPNIETLTHAARQAVDVVGVRET